MFRDASNGHAFLTRSTIKTERTIQWEDGNEYPLVNLEISAASHPFYTGTQRMLDTAGRVERFKQRYGGGGKKATKEVAKKEAPAGATPEAEATPAAEAAPTAEASPTTEPAEAPATEAAAKKAAAKKTTKKRAGSKKASAKKATAKKATAKEATKKKANAKKATAKKASAKKAVKKKAPAEKPAEDKVEDAEPPTDD